MSIEVERITKSFGNFIALNDVSLRINDGELLALLGPSGSGKTTLLRIIAGLEQPDPNPESQIRFQDANVSDRPVGKRSVGFVFQHYALFRHLSVFENIAFGLRVKPRSQRPSSAEINHRVNHLLDLIQLSGLGNRYPSQLSGGQRQRVALARALAIKPKVLLLDEPFGALDAKVRQGLRDWLRKLHHEIQLTSVLVTHDQEEALEVADRIVVMNNARIEQIGSPFEVFHHPQTPFVMEFLGKVNVFQGRVHQGQVLLGELPMGKLSEPKAPFNGDTKIYLRPHELDIGSTADRSPNLPAEIERIVSGGSVMFIHLRSFAGPLQVELPTDRWQELGFAEGDLIHVFPKRFHVFS